MWGFAKLQAESGLPFLHAANARMLLLVDSTNGQSVSNVLWGFATLDCICQLCLQDLANQLYFPSSKPGLQAIATSSLWACAHVAWTPPRPVMDAMLARMEQLLPLAIAPDFAMLLVSCVKLDMHPGKHFMQAATKPMTAVMHNAMPPTIVDIVWASAKPGLQQNQLLTEAAMVEVTPHVVRSEAFQFLQAPVGTGQAECQPFQGVFA